MKYARERAITFRHVPGKKEASPRGAERAGDSATPVCTKHCKRNDLLCHVTNRFEIFSQITALTRGGPPCFKLSRFSRNAARRHACDISSKGAAAVSSKRRSCAVFSKQTAAARTGRTKPWAAGRASVGAVEMCVRARCGCCRSHSLLRALFQLLLFALVAVVFG